MRKLAYSNKQWRMFLPLGVIMFLCTFCFGTASGQNQPLPGILTNAQIIDLVKSGLSEELIVTDIKSNLNTFDLSTSALVELKKNGVSDKVIEAMMSTHLSAPANTQALPTPTAQADTSLYIYDGDKKIRLQYARPTLEAKNSVFGPLGSTYAYVVFSEAGPAASIRVADRSPLIGEFIAPADFRISDQIQLVKLEVERSTKHRRVQVSRVSAGGSINTNIPDSARISVTFNVVRDLISNGKPAQVYNMKPVAPLGPGEYAIVFSGKRFMDFGID